MTKNEIMEQLKGVLRDSEFMSLQIEPENFTMETSLINDLVLDSIQILELISKIESHFEIVVDAFELNLDMFNRAGDLVDYIDNKIQNSSGYTLTSKGW